MKKVKSRRAQTKEERAGTRRVELTGRPPVSPGGLGAWLAGCSAPRGQGAAGRCVAELGIQRQGFCLRTVLARGSLAPGRTRPGGEGWAGLAPRLPTARLPCGLVRSRQMMPGTSRAKPRVGASVSMTGRRTGLNRHQPPRRSGGRRPKTRASVRRAVVHDLRPAGAPSVPMRRFLMP